MDHFSSAEKPQPVRKPNLLLARSWAVAVASAGFFVGWDVGTAGAVLDLPWFRSRFRVLSSAVGIVVATFNVGSIFACFLLLGRASPRKVGYAWCHRGLCIIYVVSSLAFAAAMAAAREGAANVLAWSLFLVGRILAGVAAGGTCVVAPLYISQLCGVRRRTEVEVAFFPAAVCVLTLVGSAAALLAGSQAAKWSSGVQALVATAVATLSWWVPELPRFLVESGRRMEARGTVMRLLGNNAISEEEVSAVLRELALANPNEAQPTSEPTSPQNLGTEKSGAGMLGSDKAEPVRLAVIIPSSGNLVPGSGIIENSASANVSVVSAALPYGRGSSLTMAPVGASCSRQWAAYWRLGSPALIISAFHQLTGVNFFFYFGKVLFEFVLGSGSAAQTAIVIMSAVNVVGSLCSGVILSRFGLRRVLIVGLGILLVLLLVFASLGLQLQVSPSLAVGRVLVAVVCTFIFCFALSWGPGMAVVCTQLCGHDCVLMSWLVICGWTTNAVVMTLTPPLVDLLSYGVGFVFAAFTCALGVYVWLLIG